MDAAHLHDRVTSAAYFVSAGVKCFGFVGSQFVGTGDGCTLKHSLDVFLRCTVECVVIC